MVNTILYVYQNIVDVFKFKEYDFAKTTKNVLI